MKPLLLLVLLILLGGRAVAAVNDCIQIDNDLDRLACYDKEAGRTSKQEKLPNSAGKWEVQQETSKLTDQVNVYLTVESNEVINCGWNRGDRIRLRVRCVENTTALIFQTGCHMTSSGYSDYGNITYRLDEEKARTVRANESTNNRSLGLWSGAQSIPVIKSMFGKSSMIVRMTPFGQNPFTATFDISGLEQAIAPLRKACKW